MAHISKNKFL